MDERGQLQVLHAFLVPQVLGRIWRRRPVVGAPSQDSSPVLRAAVTVRNKKGLHVRPAERLATLASRFQSLIRLAKDSREVDAKSTLEILTLGAPEGTVLEVRASGADATQAMEAIRQMFENYFGMGAD